VHQELAFGEELLGLLSALDGLHLVPVLGQHRGEGKPHVLLVVHEQDGREGLAHAAAVMVVFGGKVRVKVVPFPSVDSITTLPP